MIIGFRVGHPKADRDNIEKSGIAGSAAARGKIGSDGKTQLVRADLEGIPRKQGLVGSPVRIGHGSHEAFTVFPKLNRHSGRGTTMGGVENVS